MLQRESLGLPHLPPVQARPQPLRYGAQALQQLLPHLLWQWDRGLQARFLAQLQARVELMVHTLPLRPAGVGRQPASLPQLQQELSLGPVG